MYDGYIMNFHIHTENSTQKKSGGIQEESFARFFTTSHQDDGVHEIR